HPQPSRATLLPYTTLFRSRLAVERGDEVEVHIDPARWCHRILPSVLRSPCIMSDACAEATGEGPRHHLVLNFASAHASMRAVTSDRKSTRLNSSHGSISYA